MIVSGRASARLEGLEERAANGCARPACEDNPSDAERPQAGKLPYSFRVRLTCGRKLNIFLYKER
jgi:hypothetical protein